MEEGLLWVVETSNLHIVEILPAPSSCVATAPHVFIAVPCSLLFDIYTTLPPSFRLRPWSSINR